MNHCHLSIFLLTLSFTISCAEQDIVNDNKEIPDSEFVDLSFQIADDAQTKVPLTDAEAKISHLYLFVVGNDSSVLQVIDKKVVTTADLNLECKKLERSKFPITLRVLANLYPASNHAYLLSASAGSWLDAKEIVAAKTSQTISAWSIFHTSGLNGPNLQLSDLPKIGNKVVEIEEVGKLLTVPIKNILAKIAIANSIELTSLRVTPRVKSYSLNGRASVPHGATSSIQYPTEGLLSASLSVYLLPGSGNKVTENTGIEYTIKGGKNMKLLLPNIIKPNNYYARTLSASGIVVSVPGVSNPGSGIVLKNYSGQFYVEVETDIPYSVAIESNKDWLRKDPMVSKVGNKETHKFLYSEQDLINQARIVVRDASGSFQQIIPVTYSPRDGEVKVLKQSTKPNPINIVVVGDGFRPIDNKPGNDFDQVADNIINRFFGYAPFSQYKEYFSVYQVYANSMEAGADNDKSADYQANNEKNTVFNSTFWYGGIQRLLFMKDGAKVDEYVSKATNRCQIVLGVVNSWVYGGSGGAYAVSSRNGNAPLIAIHEIGHVFSLADEYVDVDYARINGITIEHARNRPNVDITGDSTLVKWKHFIKRPGYNGEGTFEGGNYLLNGVWRPSKNSMMNAMNTGFNAISRETIVKKIMEWSGETYDFDLFLKKDAIRSSVPAPSIYTPFDAKKMPVPLEYYVKPSDMPEARSKRWKLR